MKICLFFLIFCLQSHTNYPFLACGGVLTDDEGVITSPGYPNDYDEHNCYWVIKTSPGSKIMLYMEDLEITDSYVYLVLLFCYSNRQ